jgi:hypothetical protein
MSPRRKPPNSRGYGEPMGSTYRIRVVMDNSQSVAANRQNQQAARETAKAQDKAAKDAQKTADKAAADLKKAADKAAADAKRTADRSAADAKKTADKTAADAKKLSDKAVDDARKAAEERDKIADRFIAREHARALRDARQKAAAAARANKDVLTDEQVMQAARNRIVDSGNRRRVASAARAMGEQSNSLAEGIAQATGFEQALTKAGLAMLAFSTAKSVVSAVVGAFVEGKKASEEMATQVLETLGALRELAAIRGKYAPDETELARHIDVRKASGLTHAQAVDYQEQLFNALGTVTTDRLSEDERKKLEVGAAPFVARTARDPATARAKAGMIGLLPNFITGKGGGPLTARDVTEEADKIDEILNRGGSSTEVMTSNYQQVLTAMTGDEDMKGFFHDPKKAAGLTAIASSFAKEAPATAVIQAVRPLRDFTKMRKKKGLTASQSQTLTEMKITEFDEPDQVLMKLFKYADENFKDEAFDVALGRRGFGDATGNKGLAQFYGAYKKGVFQDIMKDTDAAAVPGLAGQKDAAYLASDFGRLGLAQAGLDAAKLQRGQAGIPLKLAKIAAEERLTQQDFQTDPLARLQSSFFGAVTGGQASGDQIMIEQEAMRRLREQTGGKDQGLGARVDRALVGGMLGPLAGAAYEKTAGSSLLAPAVDYLFGGNTQAAQNLDRLANAAETLARKADGATTVLPGAAPAPLPPAIPPRAGPSGQAGRP